MAAIEGLVRVKLLFDQGDVTVYQDLINSEGSQGRMASTTAADKCRQSRRKQPRHTRKVSKRCLSGERK